MSKLVLVYLVLNACLILGQESACDSCSRALMDMLDQANQDLNYLNNTYKIEQANDRIKSRLRDIELAAEQSTVGLSHAQLMFNVAKEKLTERLEKAELVSLAQAQQYSTLIRYRLEQQKLVDDLSKFHIEYLLRMKKLLN